MIDVKKMLEETTQAIEVLRQMKKQVPSEVLEIHEILQRLVAAERTSVWLNVNFEPRGRTSGFPILEASRRLPSNTAVPVGARLWLRETDTTSFSPVQIESIDYWEEHDAVVMNATYPTQSDEDADEVIAELVAAGWQAKPATEFLG